MTQPRQPRPYGLIQRHIQTLEAVQQRHRDLTRLARLEREVAALPDPREASANELASQGSAARINLLLREMAQMRASLASASDDEDDD